MSDDPVTRRDLLQVAGTGIVFTGVTSHAAAGQNTEAELELQVLIANPEAEPGDRVVLEFIITNVGDRPAKGLIQVGSIQSEPVWEVKLDQTRDAGGEWRRICIIDGCSTTWEFGGFDTGVEIPPGESRNPRIPLLIQEDAEPGQYELEVSVSLDSQDDSRNVGEHDESSPTIVIEDESSSTGDTSPTEISTLEELQAIENNLSDHYVLVNHIDATETETWNDGDGFEPIGAGPLDGSTPPFSGTFDGQGYEIRGLTIDKGITGPDTAEIGVFGEVDDGGEIRNVGVVDTTITAGTDVGCLVGRLDNGTVERAYATGNISGNSDLGGLVGHVASDGVVSESYADVDIEPLTDTDGFNAGGLVGTVQGTVDRSFALGSVDGISQLGGLVGNLQDEWQDGEVSECYATGPVTADKTAPSHSPDATGGLVGRASDGDGVDRSYWDVDVSGQEASDGGTGLSSSEMTGSDAPTHMSGFDFAATWDVEPDWYPTLEWMDTPETHPPSIDADSIDLDRYAATPTGTQPTLSVAVENAASVRVFSSHLPDGESVPLERQDGHVWTGEVAIDSGQATAGDRVTLTIEAENNAGETATVDGFPDLFPDDSPDFNMTEDIRGYDIQYFLFDEVKDVAVLIGTLSGEDDVREWRQEQWSMMWEIDLNRYFAGVRGFNGNVGFNLTWKTNGDVGYSVEERSHYENRALPYDDLLDTPRERWGWGMGSVPDFAFDVADAAGYDFAESPHDFWLVTHPGESFAESGDLPLLEEKDISGAYIDEHGLIYAHEAYSASTEDFVTWVHEIGHALGYHHTTDAGIHEEKDAMGGSTGGRSVFDQNKEIAEPMATAVKLADTLGFDQQDSTAFGDYFEPDETDLSGSRRSGVVMVPQFKQLEEGDAVPLLTHGSTTFVLEYRGLLQGYDTDADFDDDEPGNEWGQGDGAVVIYKHEPGDGPAYDAVVDSDSDSPYLVEDGDTMTAVIGGEPDEQPAYELEFTLDGFGEVDGRNIATVRYNKTVSNSVRATLSGTPAQTSSLTIGECQLNAPDPTVHLRGEDAQGRVVGMTRGGQWVNEIPGAIGSGKRNGDEWIRVPADVDIEFTVTGDQLDAYLDAFEQFDGAEEFTDELQRELRTDVSLTAIEYEDDAELFERGDGADLAVSGASVRGDSASIEPGLDYTVTVEEMNRVESPAVRDSDDPGQQTSDDDIDWLPIAGAGAGIAGVASAAYWYLNRDND